MSPIDKLNFIQDVMVLLNAYTPTSDARKYTSVVANSVGFAWSHVLIMLTVDRFLHVFLNIKYSVYMREVWKLFPYWLYRFW